MMADCYRVLVVEEDQDPTVYLRLVLVRTVAAPGGDQLPEAQQPGRCPTRVQAMLKGITSTINGVARIGTGPVPPIIFIVDAAHARREVLSGFFRSAGCTAIAVADVEQPGSWCPLIVPDLLVLPEPAGWCARGVDTLRARYPQCPVAVTSVLDCLDHDQQRAPVQLL
jgi:hypothetical protein